MERADPDAVFRDAATAVVTESRTVAVWLRKQIDAPLRCPNTNRLSSRRFYRELALYRVELESRCALTTAMAELTDSLERVERLYPASEPSSATPHY